MPKSIVVPVTQKNAKVLKKRRGIIFEFDKDRGFDNEYLNFYDASSISQKRSNGERFLGIREGSRASYYLRRNEESNQSFDRYFKREGEVGIGFVIYANDSYASGPTYGIELSYNGLIYFPMTKIQEGVSEAFRIVMKKSKSGLLKALTESEREMLKTLICEDLVDQRHTKRAVVDGQVRDTLAGM